MDRPTLSAGAAAAGPGSASAASRPARGNRRALIAVPILAPHSPCSVRSKSRSARELEARRSAALDCAGAERPGSRTSSHPVAHSALPFRSASYPASCPACANFNSCGRYGCTSGLPRAERSFQPCTPSKTRTDLSPSALICRRVLLGRFCSSLNCMLGKGACALSMWPIHTIVSTLRHASRPPPAATFFATISAAESFAADAHPAANATAMSPTAIVAAAMRFISPPPLQPRASGLRFGERRRIELRVHRDFLEDDLVRLRIAVDDRLEDKGHHQALHRAKITLIHPHATHPAVHPPRDALDLDVEEAVRVDPDVQHGAGLARELELVGVVALDRLNALDLDLRSLRRGVDQWVTHVGVLSLGLRFLWRGRVDVVAVEIGAQLPGIRAVVDLHRGLARELDLEARLVGALLRERERQLHLLLGLLLVGGAGRNFAPQLLRRRPRASCNPHAAGDRVAGSGIHLAAQRQRLDGPPRLQPTPRRDVLLDDLRRAQAWGCRLALGREQRVRKAQGQGDTQQQGFPARHRPNSAL